MARYIIIHGSFSSNESNWFPWLANVLRGDGLEVNVPQMPVGVGKQNFESRSEELDKLNVSEKSAALIITLALTLTTIP